MGILIQALITISHILILFGGITAIIVGTATLLFQEKFLQFNDFINKTLFIRRKYKYTDFNIDRWIFSRSGYWGSVLLILIGIALMLAYIFIIYQPASFFSFLSQGKLLFW